MRYPVFLAYDVIGAVGWGVGLVVVGYHLGGIPFVGAHLELMVLAIACLSILPVAVSAARALLTRRGAASTDEDAPPAELTAGPTSAT
jgi:membrane-associated protein